MERADFYIYCYFHPDTGEPCYIGRGQGTRWKTHLWKSHNRRLRNLVVRSGGEIPYIKIHNGLTNKQANEYEIELIKAIGRAPNGPLFNKTDGGEGMSGHIPGPETRAKRSASLRGKKKSPEHIAKMSASLTGRKLSPEHCAKISPIGRKLSPETRKQIGESQRGKIISPETRAKQSQRMRGRKASLETRAKMSAARFGRKQSPEAIAKSATARRGRKLSSDQIAKMRGRTFSLETRAGMSIAARNRHDRKRPPATGNLFAHRPADGPPMG